MHVDVYIHMYIMHADVHTHTILLATCDIHVYIHTYIQYC